MRVNVSTCLSCALAVLFWTSVGWANDSTIPCKAPPDKGASVAVHPGTQVSTTQDRQNGTCTFSVNGAVATSPPAQQVLEALNILRDPSRQFVNDKDRAITVIATLSAASAPVDEVPRDMIEILAKSSGLLQQCLNVFFRQDGLPVDIGDGQTFVCKGVAPYTNVGEKREMLAGAGLAVGLPTLVISTRWGDGRFVSVVYLPRP